MEKFSVKKPFTVLVAVIMVLMLGFVSITKMKTNLLPNVSTPYLMVVTVYPGASPERVETEVSDVLQNALTVPGVSKITATSAENYSLLLMQFVDDTDMDSALVQVSNKLDQAKSDLPSSCLTPSIIEYSLNMNAFMTVAVSREGSDIYQLSELVKDTLVPYVQRKGGVSNVSSSGLVEKLVQVQLNQDKIDEIMPHITAIPVVMPYITSQFMPRKLKDRPEVIPYGNKNLAFIGQFVELEGDVVFTVETSVRTAMIAVYRLLHQDRPITPLFQGQYDIRMVNVALKTLLGKDKIEVSDLPKVNPLKLPQTMHEIVEAINQIPPVPEYYSERKENL